MLENAEKYFYGPTIYIWVLFYLNKDNFLFKKKNEKMSFLTFKPFHPSSAPAGFRRMPPAFIMSSGMQPIRSTYESNSTIYGEQKCFLA